MGDVPMWAGPYVTDLLSRGPVMFLSEFDIDIWMRCWFIIRQPVLRSGHSIWHTVQIAVSCQHKLAIAERWPCHALASDQLIFF